MESGIFNVSNASIPLGYSASVTGDSQNDDNILDNSLITPRSFGTSLQCFRYNGTPSSIHVHSRFKTESLEIKKTSKRKSTRLSIIKANKENSISNPEISILENNSESQIPDEDVSFGVKDAINLSENIDRREHPSNNKTLALKNLSNTKSTGTNCKNRKSLQKFVKKNGDNCRKIDGSVDTIGVVHPNKILSEINDKKRSFSLNPKPRMINIANRISDSGVGILDEIFTSKTPMKRKPISSSKRSKCLATLTKNTSCPEDEIIICCDNDSTLQSDFSSVKNFAVGVKKTGEKKSSARIDSSHAKEEIGNKKVTEVKKICKWAILFSKGRICIEGYTRTKSGDQALFRTSSISEVHDSGRTLVTTSGSKYELKGKMLLQASLDAGVSLSLAKKFVNGFPSGWQTYCKRYKDLDKSDSGSYQGKKDESTEQNHTQQISQTRSKSANLHQKLSLSSLSEDTECSIGMSETGLKVIEDPIQESTPTDKLSKPSDQRRTRHSVHTTSTTPPKVGVAPRTRNRSKIHFTVEVIQDGLKDTKDESEEVQDILDIGTHKVDKRSKKKRKTITMKSNKRSSVKALYNTPNAKTKISSNKSTGNDKNTTKTSSVPDTNAITIENVVRNSTRDSNLDELNTKSLTISDTVDVRKIVKKKRTKKKAARRLKKKKTDTKDTENISISQVCTRSYKVPITPLNIENVAEKFKVSIPEDLLEAKTQKGSSDNKKRKRENVDVIARPKKRPKRGKTKETNANMPQPDTNSTVAPKVTPPLNHQSKAPSKQTKTKTENKTKEEKPKIWTSYQKRKLSKLVAQNLGWKEISEKMKFPAIECENIYNDIFRNKRRKTIRKEKDPGSIKITARRGTLKHRTQVRQKMEVLKRPKPQFQDIFLTEEQQQNTSATDNMFSADLFAVPTTDNVFMPFTPNSGAPVGLDATLATPAWFKTPNASSGGFGNNGWTPMTEINTPAAMKDVFSPEPALSRDEELQRKVADRVIVQMQKKMLRGTLQEYKGNKAEKKLLKSGKKKKKYNQGIDFDVLKDFEQTQESSDDETEKDEYFDLDLEE